MDKKTTEPISENGRMLLQECIKFAQTNPSEWSIIACAMELTKNSEDTTTEEILTLAKRICDIPANTDEARFTINDYADAVTTHCLAPNITLLNQMYDAANNKNIWERLIITIATSKRATYESQWAKLHPLYEDIVRLTNELTITKAK